MTRSKASEKGVEAADRASVKKSQKQAIEAGTATHLQPSCLTISFLGSGWRWGRTKFLKI
ncbi:hypothetical protein DHL47_12085 [Streptococcus panodentis]|uniref:Uncharacterized protein n=1 Tax=Streptococcus panodentis TaxID=1581472 RepID=A0ABS5B055_9STRE|nr:hypothetical protein [Streptococcus panodentis]